MTEDLKILYAVLLKFKGKVSKIEYKNNTYTFRLICPYPSESDWMRIFTVILTPNEEM
ncbi:hypothetical protein LCGC14_1536020 [marine sediment metagenome]|uniref:Uncharacterized protein n=1 Tax=marine sediment metagenome TaxID=412755 RepID=A0A0F9LVB8_9ZZZZ